MVIYQIHVLLQIPCNRIQEILHELLQLNPHYKKKFQHIQWHVTPNTTVVIKLHSTSSILQKAIFTRSDSSVGV
jgi:hypothetical protein